MIRRAAVPALVALIAAFTQIPSHAGQPRTTRGKATKAAQELPGPQRPYVPAGTEAMGEWPSMITLAGPWKYHTDPRVSAQAHRPEHDDSNWPTLHVPSNWYLQGLYRSGSVWFRRTFRVPRGQAGRRTRIVFDGVDYAAEVWLNGHQLGTHTGYFERFSFVVGPRLYDDRDNVLAVRVDSPLETGPSWSLHKKLIKGVFGHHDARPGNAWSDRGQDRNTGGIWGHVGLKPAGDLSLDGIHVRADAMTPQGKALEDGQTARLSATVFVGSAAKATARVTLRATVTPYNFTPAAKSSATTSIERIVAPGESDLALMLDVPAVQRWQVWERGHPYLYRLDVQLIDRRGAVLDSVSRVFGFRTIAFDAVKGEWKLNGRRIFLRGTNYIASQWLGEMTPAFYRLDLGLMQQAGINAIRVHAHVEGEDLYRQADEAGMLIWQDFPLQWGYVDDAKFTTEAVRQAVAMVDQLDHHPSIVAWSGHNEPPWDAAWMKTKYPDYRPDQNRELDRALAAALRHRDPSRYVHEASTTAEHPWLGWYSGAWSDYGRATTQTLITEFGAQALPDLEHLRRFIPEKDLWPEDDAGWETWRDHDFQPHETFTLAKVERGASVTEMIANTQRYQAQLVQFAAEAYRRQKHAPVGAIFQFMFNECWPSANWGIVDYWRRPKPGFAALARAYQPVLPSIEWTPEKFTPERPVVATVWIVNDLWTGFDEASLEWTLRTGAKVVESMRTTVNVAPDHAVAVTRFEKALAAGDYTLSATVSDSKGRPLGRNEWSFRVDALVEKPAMERITTEKRAQDGRAPEKGRLEKRPADASRVETRPGNKHRER
jgi:beta-mannosidase